MKNVESFLAELRVNNNREWFEANKARYKVIQEEFNNFVEKLIDEISAFDPSISGVTVKDSTYRIYRDVRFSPNKEPYKTHIGAYVCKGGKKSGYAGYYFHVEPVGCILAVGLHCPEPKVLRSVRDEIFANGADFQKSIDLADGFAIDRSSSLKKVPRDYPADFQQADYLKLKEFDIVKSFNPADKNLLKHVSEEFKRAKSFNDILNRAVEFAFQEM